MKVVMPPPLAPGTRVGGRDRWSAWFIHSLRSIWDRVGAQLARRRPGWFSGQVESSRLPTDRYSAAPTPDGWAARGAGHAYDQTVDRLTNPISMRQAGQETPICTPSNPARNLRAGRSSLSWSSPPIPAGARPSRRN
jgi:hypothetical protein